MNAKSIIVFLSIFGASVAGLSQKMSITVNAAEVLLYVSVWDHFSNRSIHGLKGGDFQVFEDGVLQNSELLMLRDLPYSILLLLDDSGSTWSYTKQMKRAASTFVGDIDEGNKIAVARFNSKVYLLQNFTDDTDLAIKAINRIGSGGGTAFYDALMTGVEKYLPSVSGRKAIVVFTDGFDNSMDEGKTEGSRITFEQLYKKLEEVDALVYPIMLDTKDIVPIIFKPDPKRLPGIITNPKIGKFPLPLPRIPLPSPSESPFPNPNPRSKSNTKGTRKLSKPANSAKFEIARNQLEMIAELTGGIMYPLYRDKELAAVYKDILDDLRTRYVLSYSPSNKNFNNEKRVISVTVKDHPEAVVRTRTSYVASKKTSK